MKRSMGDILANARGCPTGHNVDSCPWPHPAARPTSRCEGGAQKLSARQNRSTNDQLSPDRAHTASQVTENVSYITPGHRRAKNRAPLTADSHRTTGRTTAAAPHAAGTAANRSPSTAEGRRGGGADRTRPELPADAIHGLFAHEPRLSRGIQADLPSDLAGIDESLAPQGDAGRACALQARAVHQLVFASAQQQAELDDDVEQGAPDGRAVQGVGLEAVAYGGEGGQHAGHDGARVDPVGAVGGQAAGLRPGFFAGFTGQGFFSPTFSCRAAAGSGVIRRRTVSSA